MDKFTHIEGKGEPTARDAFLDFIHGRCAAIVESCSVFVLRGENPIKILLSAAMSGYATGCLHTMDSETSNDPIQREFRSLLRAFQIEHEASVRRIKEMVDKEKDSRS